MPIFFFDCHFFLSSSFFFIIFAISSPFWCFRLFEPPIYAMRFSPFRFSFWYYAWLWCRLTMIWLCCLKRRCHMPAARYDAHWFLPRHYIGVLLFRFHDITRCADIFTRYAARYHLRRLIFRCRYFSCRLMMPPLMIFMPLSLRHFLFFHYISPAAFAIYWLSFDYLLILFHISPLFFFAYFHYFHWLWFFFSDAFRFFADICALRCWCYWITHDIICRFRDHAYRHTPFSRRHIITIILLPPPRLSSDWYALFWCWRLMLMIFSLIFAFASLSHAMLFSWLMLFFATPLSMPFADAAFFFCRLPTLALRHATPLPPITDYFLSRCRFRRHVRYARYATPAPLPWAAAAAMLLFYTLSASMPADAARLASWRAIACCRASAAWFLRRAILSYFFMADWDCHYFAPCHAAAIWYIFFALRYAQRICFVCCCIWWRLCHAACRAQR